MGTDFVFLSVKIRVLCLHFLDLNRRDAKNAEEKLKETLCSLRLCGKFLSGTRKTAKIVGIYYQLLSEVE